MLKHLKAEAGMARTENGAVTFATTRSACLDLFASIGGLLSAGNRSPLGYMLDILGAERYAMIAA